MFAITSDPIDVDALAQAVVRPGCGAVVTFVGLVRDVADDGASVQGLSYETHDSMAVQTFETIAQRLRERHGNISIGIVHRKGDLAIEEIAVAVVVAAPHRAAAFAACAEAIDELKREAPIWKKERYRDGGARWRENAP